MHSDAQVAQTAGSITEFGFVNPVLVGADDVIIAGHGRVLAARKLGLCEVPVIVLGHLSNTQRRALAPLAGVDRQVRDVGWRRTELLRDRRPRFPDDDGP